MISTLSSRDDNKNMFLKRNCIRNILEPYILIFFYKWEHSEIIYTDIFSDCTLFSWSEMRNYLDDTDLKNCIIYGWQYTY